MRVIVILLAVFLIVLCGWLAYYYNQTAFKAQATLNQERYTRMTAEEGLEKAKEKISSLESELSKTQNKINGLAKMVEQTKAINEDLKSRVDKAMVIKDNLESKIRELEQTASVTPPAAVEATSIQQQPVTSGNP